MNGPLGVVLNGQDRPLITRGFDAFTSGNYTGAGRWGLFMEANHLTFGVPAIAGRHFQWATYADNSAVAATLMTLNQSGQLGVGVSNPTQRLDVNGGILARAYGAISEQGAYLQWNRTNGDGATWLLNQRGLGTGGIYFGASDAVSIGSNTVTEWARFDGSGNLGLGTAPGARLHVAGRVKIDGTNTLEFGAGVTGKEVNAGKIGYRAFSADALDIVGAGTGSNRVIRFYAEGGAAFNAHVNATAFNTTSDARFKTNVRPIGGALAAVLALRGVRYEWNALGIQHGGKAGAPQVGLLAQELEQVYPELVHTDAQGYKAVNYAQLTAVLLEALKEQQAQIETLKAEASAAEAEATTVKAQATATSDAFEARLRRLEAAGAQAQR